MSLPRGSGRLSSGEEIMIRTRTLSFASFLLAATLSTGITATPAAYAQAPDNSGQNKAESPTADNQSNTRSDRETTAQIRKALVADKGLSTYAHNVKIIVQGGKVTLKGPVRSNDERQKVLSDAGSVVSSGQIADQLTVKQ
jgi:hyperosmotically inducible protein